MKEIYKEVRNDYHDGSSNFTTIDAWLTDDDNEEGKVVAVVHDSGDYWIIDPDAGYDPKVMNAINEVRSRLIEDANPPEKLSRDIVIEQEKPLMLCSWLLP